MKITRRDFFNFFSKKNPIQSKKMPAGQGSISFRALGSSPYVGEILLVPYNFAPSGWAFCDGRLMSISSNTALFSLLGTTYGGNGQSTFALPDLRNRSAMGSGAGPGLTEHFLGEPDGIASFTLSTNNIPGQTINVNEIMVRGAGGTQGVGLAKGTITGTTTLAGAQTPTPVDNMPPYVGLNYIIALQGIFPPRS